MRYSKSNRDEQVIQDFGSEWQAFDQGGARLEDLQSQFNSYFSLFPWDSLDSNSVGFDVGSGSGRWDTFLAPKVGHLHCVEPSSEAMEVARIRLDGMDNVTFHLVGVDALPFEDDSMDFGVSLGVLHHVPNTAAALKACARPLKPGAPFLVYLYYNFENRPLWFRMCWRLTDFMRRGVSKLPFRLKILITSSIATFIYFPLARISALMESLGLPPQVIDVIPLSSYRNWSFYWMRTDALDRFGTRLEQRFSKADIAQMMADAGFVEITFKDGRPMWTALGWKAKAL